MIIDVLRFNKSSVLAIVIASEIGCMDTSRAQCFTRVSPVRPKVEVYLNYSDTRPIGVDDASSIPPGLCVLATKAGRYEVVLASAQVWVPRSEFSAGQTPVQPLSPRQYAPAAGPAATATPAGYGPSMTSNQTGAGAGQLAYAGTDTRGNVYVRDMAGHMYLMDKKGRLHRTAQMTGPRPATQRFPQTYQFTTPPGARFAPPFRAGASRFR